MKSVKKLRKIAKEIESMKGKCFYKNGMDYKTYIKVIGRCHFSIKCYMLHTAKKYPMVQFNISRQVDIETIRRMININPSHFNTRYLKMLDFVNKNEKSWIN